MKAWVCKRFSDPFELELTDIPVPEPREGEVRVRVSAAGLAFGETLILEGGYQKTPQLPYIPCSEMSGIVDAVGPDVAKLRVGDRVAAFSVSLSGGGLAEYCVLPQQFLHQIADEIDLADAAAILMNNWTAYNALFRRANIAAGETLVVFGASGGVGSAALAVGQTLGARTIAVGSDPAAAEFIGAAEFIDYRDGDVYEKVRQLTGGRGADVYFDPVGGEMFDQAMRAIAPAGRILVVGFTSGKPADVRTNLVLVKMISIIGVEGRLAIEETGQQGWNDLHTLVSLINEGKIRLQPTVRYKFLDAPKALNDLRSRRTKGKLIVKIAA